MLHTPKWLKKKYFKVLATSPLPHTHSLFILPDASQVPSPNKKQRPLLKYSLLINRYVVLFSGIIILNYRKLVRDNKVRISLRG